MRAVPETDEYDGYSTGSWVANLRPTWSQACEVPFWTGVSIGVAVEELEKWRKLGHNPGGAESATIPARGCRKARSCRAGEWQAGARPALSGLVRGYPFTAATSFFGDSIP